MSSVVQICINVQPLLLHHDIEIGAFAIACDFLVEKDVGYLQGIGEAALYAVNEPAAVYVLLPGFAGRNIGSVTTIPDHPYRVDGVIFDKYFAIRTVFLFAGKQEDDRK